MTKLVNLVALVWKSCNNPILAFLAQRYTDGNKMGMQPVPATPPSAPLAVLQLISVDEISMQHNELYV